MRWFGRALLLASLAVSTVTAELSFTASMKQDGKEVDVSKLDFRRVPPLRHGRRRAHGGRGGRGGQRGDQPAARDLISYSSNWCGASQHTTQNDGISNVVGYFQVPDLTLRPGAPPPQFAAAWVGIDGAECNTTLLQAGVTTVVNSNGGQSAYAWWEWYPEAAFSIDSLRVKPGEWLSVDITASSPTSGIIVIHNLDRGTSITLHITNGPKLCRLDAEWIVEDFYDGDQQVNFGKFTDMWFVDVAAKTVSGKNIGIDGAAMVHLLDDSGKTLCSAEPYDNANFIVMSHD
ncbi:hypothetical protein VTJ49DRAFT_7196 [Mycothermus thermophilus]|uniref:Concanavalin A-like lectin/glucanase n=1 Tax=Humicola insolens TaxID=85995 RepID=A0ABR3VPW6_HUMIN